MSYRMLWTGKDSWNPLEVNWSQHLHTPPKQLSRNLVFAGPTTERQEIWSQNLGSEKMTKDNFQKAWTHVLSRNSIGKKKASPSPETQITPLTGNYNQLYESSIDSALGHWKIGMRTLDEQRRSWRWIDEFPFPGHMGLCSRVLTLSLTSKEGRDVCDMHM